jgi:hypothetical protein
MNTGNEVAIRYGIITIEMNPNTCFVKVKGRRKLFEIMIKEVVVCLLLPGIKIASLKATGIGDLHVFWIGGSRCKTIPVPVVTIFTSVLGGFYYRPPLNLEA